MKLIFLIILLCGITTNPVHTVTVVKAKKVSVCQTTAKKVNVPKASLDMVPSGLLFQF